MSRLWTMLLCAFMAVGLVGCRDSRHIPMGSDGQPKITIMVGGIDKVIYLPAILAQRLGYFVDQGVDVELLSQPNGANAETSLLTGDVQATVGFYDHTIDLQAKDQCITSVVQFANVPGEVVMVGKGDQGDIRSAKDFADRNIGVTSLGSSTDFLTKALADRAGVDTTTIHPVKVGAGQTFIAALNKGNIDAGMTTDPTVAQLTNSGDGEVLVDMRTEKGTRAALGGLYPASSMYMSCEIVRHYPELTQKLATAFVRTLRWMKTHSPEQIAATMPPSFAAAGKDLYVQSLRDSLGMFNATGRMDSDGARNVLKVLSGFSVNVKPHARDIDLSKTYTTEFVDRANQELR